MNFKKVGQAVMILGTAIVLYGGFQGVSNIPEKVNREDPYSEWIHGHKGQADQLDRENTRRREKQDEATIIIIAGGIVSLRDSSLHSHYQTGMIQTQQMKQTGRVRQVYNYQN